MSSTTLSTRGQRTNSAGIDTAALSEVRFAGQGSLTEDGAGYTLLWLGKNNDKRRLSGVGFMVKTCIARKLQILPVGHSDRFMSLRLPVQDNKFATVFSVYAPTPQAETGVKEAFYRDLHNFMQQVDSKHKLFIFIIIIYPFTARVVGAPQMISQPVSSIFPCSPLPSGICRTPGLSIP